MSEADPQPGAGAPDGPRLEAEVAELRSILVETRRRVERWVILEGVLWWGVTLCAVALSTLAVALVAPGAVPAVTTWIFWGGVGSAGLAAVIALITFKRGRGGSREIARRLQRHAPVWRDDLVAALEFAERVESAEAGELGFSEPMARAHISRTVKRVRAEVREGHLGHLLPRRTLGPPAAAVGLAVAVLTVPVVWKTSWVGAVLGSPWGAAGESARVETSEQPIVGNLSLAYAFPAYTGLGERFDGFSTGQIEAVEGTEVRVRATPLMAVGALELVHEVGEESEVLTMQPTAGGALEASLVVLESGSYRFRARLEDGGVVEGAVERSITALPDAPPRVSITSHSGQLDVSPADVIEIEVDVEDDYGVEAVQRVYFFAGDEESASRETVEVPGLVDGPTSATATFRFDLAPLALQPKDVVVLRVEASDDNTVTGPGLGQSEPLVLRVASPEDKHLENIARQQALLEELLVLTADYLVNPLGEREAVEEGPYRQVVEASTPMPERVERVRAVGGVHTRGVDLVARFGELVGQLEQDPLMLERDTLLIAGLHKDLAGVHEELGEELALRRPSMSRGELTVAQVQALADKLAAAEDVLEKGLLRFEELLASQKMEAVRATAEDIEALKDRLKELLQQYKETRDPELKEAIMREVKRLRQRMQELASRMQTQLKKLPQEHVNMEALRQQQLESDTQKMSDNLRSIEELLEQGDVDGALAALEQMESGLESLTEEMGAQFAEAQPQGLNELDQAVSELMDQVNDLQEAERELERETRALEESLRQQREQQVEEMLDTFLREQRDRVERQLAELDQVVEQGRAQQAQGLRRSLERLEKMLEQRDVAQALEEAEGSLRETRRLGFDMDLAQRYTPSSDPASDRLKKAKEHVRRMQGRGQEIVDDLEGMMAKADQEFEEMGRGQMKALAERQRAIAEQSERLGERVGEASRRFPMLGQQLKPAMEGSRRAMEDAASSLEGGRAQQALDAERRALEQLGALKQQMKQVVQRQKQEARDQGQQVQRDEVAIPGESGRDAGDALREDLMEGMKQGRLDEYESEIERYYKSLVE